MRIVIVGGGVVGFSLAEHLMYDNHDVSLVEKDPNVCRIDGDRLDIKLVCGNGSSPRVLEAAGIEGADMVLAVTPVDELNIIVCAIARQYGIKSRIARIRSNEFRGRDAAIDIGKMGVTLVIDPEQVVVDSIIQYIETPGASDASNFQEGNILVRAYQVTEDMPVANKTLSEIGKGLENQPLLFVAAIRDGEGFIPHGDYLIEPGDEIYGIFQRDSIDTYLELFNQTRKDVKNVVITGDSLTAVQLADTLQNLVEKVVLVDPDAEHARQAADILNNIDIVHGDCTESSILKEVYVRNAQFFIAAAKETEYNVMSTLLARAEGAREVIAVSNEIRQDRLFNSIGIDHVIYPRLAIAREILEAIHRGQIGQVVRIRNLNIEALRITAEENSPITGKPLQHIRSKIQKGSIISAILRDDEMIIPDGNSVIEPGDQMIVITYTRHLSRVRKLFKSRK